MPHLPEELRQQRVKLGHIAHKKWEADKNSKIKMKSDHVEVNGQKITDTVQPATIKETLFMNQKTRATVQNCEFTYTDIITCKGSEFQMFKCHASNLAYCDLAQQAIATIPSIASQTHLISAYSLHTGEIGWQDDGDHGLGKFLLKTMESNGLQDAIVFMTRHYGGVHIGKRRYEIIQQLVRQVLVNVEALPDMHGNPSYLMRPPDMTLPHPSTKDLWEMPRRTVHAAKRSDASDLAPRIVPHLPEELRQHRVKLGHIAHKKWEADKNAK